MWCCCYQGIDIPDIELVILYGAPNNVNQLHQVVFKLCYLNFY